jgi:hypothetical protein
VFGLSSLQRAVHEINDINGDTHLLASTPASRPHGPASGSRVRRRRPRNTDSVDKTAEAANQLSTNTQRTIDELLELIEPKSAARDSPTLLW